jgi:hypothetical protein
VRIPLERTSELADNSLTNICFHESPSENQRIKDVLGLIPKGRFSVLEIGARDGRISMWLATCASWLNQVETWLGLISRDCLRRGIFRSVPDLIHKIITYIRLYNRHAQPFRWTYRNPRKRISVSLTSVTQH